MNEGEVSTRIGLRGQPPSAESVMVARDIELVEWTGARYHVAHISTARTVALVRDAKRRGLPVTCEVAPHHFMLTDQACASYDTSTKVMPPLRTAADMFGRDIPPAPTGNGYGVALATDAGTFVAALAEVEVDRDRGTVQVKRIVCAQDMGEIINPEGAKIQMEGCLTMGLGYALTEEIQFDKGAIFNENYEVLS